MTRWFHNCRIHFYNHTGKLLLEGLSLRRAEEICPGLHPASRRGPPPGGEFEAPADEKLFGIGQYQQEYLDLKHSIVELSQRNTQASVLPAFQPGIWVPLAQPGGGESGVRKEFHPVAGRGFRADGLLDHSGRYPAEIEEAYASVVGTTPMMPEYGLGFWQCRLRYWNQEQLLEVAREYNAGASPGRDCTGLFHWPKMGDFRFEEEFFPRPRLWWKNCRRWDTADGFRMAADRADQ